MRVSYVRLYCDPGGASHFEDLETELESRDFAPPAAPAKVAPFLDGSATLFFAASPEWDGAVPHPAPQRQIFLVMRGAVRVTASDGEERVLAVGDLLLLDDTHGEGHGSAVVGGDDLVLFGVALADQTPAIGPSAPTG